jgi:hypothetical protein
MIPRPENCSWQIAICTWCERQTTDDENELSVETIAAGRRIVTSSDCISKLIQSF